MRHYPPGIMLIVIVLAFSLQITKVISQEFPNLRFSVEPPENVDFVNTKGITIECAAVGNPQPVISWNLVDGSNVTNVSKLRHVTADGKLVFHSFRPENFRPDVHSTVYRCTAANIIGVIRSSDVMVKGVIHQSQDTQVYDAYAIEGSTAIFKCHIPSVLSNYIKVIAWVKNDNLLIQNMLVEGGLDKYVIMPSGDLHVRDVTKGDNGSKFKCKTANRLTGIDKVSSNAGQLFATESQGTVQPRILDPVSAVAVDRGQTAGLACVSQGNPLPTVKWHKKSSRNQLISIKSDNRFIQSKSAILIKNVDLSDEGIYVCEISNEFGREHLDVTLTVNELLSAVVHPPVQIVKLSDKAVFKCETTGHPITSINWLHNGVSMNNEIGNELLVQNAGMSDRGFYQCIVRNALHMVQATAELRFSEIPPQLVETFEEKTVNVGNTVSLNCAAVGIPLPSLLWKLDSIAVMSNSRIFISSKVDKDGRIVSSLQIKELKVEDGGLYSCIAVNEDGKAEHFARINIPGPLSSRTVDELLGVSGSNIMLNCPVYGYPIDKVSWEKDGKAMPFVIRHRHFKNNSLIIAKATKQTDSGSYKCVAENNLGQRSIAVIKIQIMVPPKIIPFAFLDDQFYKGMRAHVTCAISQGDIPISFTWLKDGLAIPAGLGVVSRKYDDHTDSLSINNVGSSHSGNYSCIVRNRAGMASYTAQLLVRVPPKIVPFSFQEEHLVEGLLARVSCVVSRGDLPLKFHWEKDGVEMSPGAQGVHVRSFDEHSSILSITSVASDHNGLYTCIAGNAAGMARHSAQLVVMVPPRWISEPKYAAAIKGKDVMLHCMTEGFPKPTVAWMQAKDTTHSDVRKQLYNGDSVHIFQNGSLLLRNLNSADEGYYFCQASNGIGDGLSAVVEVRINAPPFFNRMINHINAVIGTESQLQCTVQGDTPIKIMWYKDGRVLQEVYAKYKIQTTNTSSDVILSKLLISKISREDHGNYVCLAENSFGSNKTAIQLTVKGLPEPPSNPKISSLGSRTVEIEWTSPLDGNDPINKYIIQYKDSRDSWDSAITMETVNGEPTNSIVSHLTPATHYLFRLFADNSQGRSPASAILQVTTNDDVPSGPPLNVHVEPVNTETFKVLWKAPPEKHWNGKIQGYYVGYKEVDTEDPYLFKTLLTQDPTANNMFVQIGGLKQFTKYAVIVQAYNTQGKGPESEPVIVMTSEGAPSLAPTEVRCTTLTSQSVHVTWTAPPMDSVNGILRGYKVVYKPASNWFEDVAENFNISLPTSMTISNLEKFSNYSVQVMAMTKAGEGPRSTTIFCKTLDDVPGSPADVKAIATSDDSVMVAWKSPDSPNGVLKSFTVYWKNSNDEKDTGSHSTPARENSYEVIGLKKGKRYEFWVTALTTVGEGIPSRIVAQSPSGPTVAAKVVSFDEKIISAWKSDITLPCHAVGLPKPQIRWTWNEKSVAQASKAKVLSDGSLSLSDIQEEDAGDFSCIVENDFGNDKMTYTIIVLAPPSAPILEVVSVTSDSMTFQWKIPSSKMSRIKGYVLFTRRDIGDWKETTLGSEMRSYRLSNLDCGTRYEIYMTAFNKIGIGAPSEVLLMSTNGSVPIPPNKADLIEEMSNSVSLYLNTWKSNGCSILHFIVEYCPKSSSEWISLSNNIKPEQRRLVIPGLKPGAWYGLRMTAHNSAGFSVAEYTFATLTMSGATIPPDLLSDSTSDPVDNLLSYLNFYVIVPITCTVIILLAILAISCFYIKLKGREQHVETDQGTQLSATGGTLRRGKSSESLAYMQRDTMRKSGGHHSRQDADLVPYATFQLANQNMMTPGRRNMAPPLPPPRMEGFQNSICTPMNPQFFASGGFMPGHHTSETTFVFPNPPDPNDIHFPPCYPHDAIKMDQN